MSVRRVLTVLTVVATLACWPVLARAAAQPERRAATSPSPAAAAAAVSVEADFDNDGFADLAVGVPREGVGTAELAGAVNVLEGSTNGLSGAGSQLFVQGGGGVADAAEPFDLFGSALAAGDFDPDRLGRDRDADPVDLAVDLAIGAPGRAAAGQADAGAFYAYKGGTGFPNFKRAYSQSTSDPN
jgi:FG-GAP repeat